MLYDRAGPIAIEHLQDDNTSLPQNFHCLRHSLIRITLLRQMLRDPPQQRVVQDILVELAVTVGGLVE